MTDATANRQWKADQLEDWLVKRVANIQGQLADDIDPDMPFNSLGLDSVDVMDLIVELDELLGMEIESTIIWDYPTIRLLSGYLADLLSGTHALK
ncbi:acyl carrier protein [Undibacterium sp. JH2W]|uniref:acyl carrier protein n=1 Tax=Undibacterium sp. JH2W TaxID=3413037 RepID=UPI003BF1041F